jgi:hypothetical protein
MRAFVSMIVLGAALWAVDRIAFEGRYSNAIWREATNEGQRFNQEVNRWWNKRILNFSASQSAEGTHW